VVKIKIQQFEGPLDLLLKLIEEKKLNITEVSISAVTEQFLAYMRSLTDLRPQELANWLVIASKLLVIKSRALMPLLSIPEEDEEDATDLTWQLYQYKLYKEASKHIDLVQKRKKQSWGRSSNFLQKITFYPDPKVNLATLRDTMSYLAKSLESIKSVPKKILEEVVTISAKITELQNAITKKVEIKMHKLIGSRGSKTEAIVTFLALLELVKQKILTVEQESMFSDIIIKSSDPNLQITSE